MAWQLRHNTSHFIASGRSLRKSLHLGSRLAIWKTFVEGSTWWKHSARGSENPQRWQHVFPKCWRMAALIERARLLVLMSLRRFMAWSFSGCSRQYLLLYSFIASWCRARYLRDLHAEQMFWMQRGPSMWRCLANADIGLTISQKSQRLDVASNGVLRGLPI